MYLFLSEWTINRVKQSATLTGFHTTKMSTYYNNRCVKDNDKSMFPSIVTFTEAYESFLKLQQIGKSLSCVYSESINQLPQIVGMDVTQIRLKYERLLHIITPKKSYTLHPNDDIVKMRNVVNKTQIVYINDKKLRDIAKYFLIGKEVRIYSTDKNVKNIQKFKWTKEI